MSDLDNKIKQIGIKEGGPMWFGKPDRWYDSLTWRCENNHVSKVFLKSAERGDLCLACYKPVYLTFPEDVDGTELPSQ